MKKVLFPILALVLAVGLALPMAGMAGASPDGDPAWVLLESLIVDADDDTAVTSTTTLIDGWVYRFEVSGTYSASGPYVADAEYCSADGGTTWDDILPPPYDIYGEGLLELMVDEAIVEWGAYNPSHVYTLDYVGTGSTVSFLIYDLPPYSNNSGLLTVKIYATPVMVTTSLSGPSEVAVNAEASWNITITVEALYADVTDVVVQDGMGADLDEIVVGTPSQGTADSAKRGKGRMGATMVTWDVGDLDDGDTATLVVTVTTGLQGKGKHAYTEAGTHDLDGGASATYWYEGIEYESPETDPLTVVATE